MIDLVLAIPDSAKEARNFVWRRKRITAVKRGSGNCGVSKIKTAVIGAEMDYLVGR